MKNKKTELVAPAGGLYKAEFAYKYGADACYGGLSKYSLRKAEVDFNLTTLDKAIKLAHSLNKKFYVTFNIFARNSNLKNIEKDIKIISRFKPDAFIISDPGIVEFVRKFSKVPIHLSTQANTTNWQAVNFWKKQGIKRIVLARELTLKEIKEIKDKAKGVELEVFVHGAMCISYSGRCLLSAVMAKREANQGDCAQPCRWNYKTHKLKEKNIFDKENFYLEEELRPGEFFEIQENKNGSYIMNSKDLRLIQYLPKMIDIGISAFKIEGRNKSEYYLSTIVRAYKKAINAYKNKTLNKEIGELIKETEKVAHRDYTSGFIFNNAKKGEVFNQRHPIENYRFLGIIENSNEKWHKIVARNQIKKNDKIEILTPDKIFKDTVLKIKNELEEKQDVANPIPGKRYTYLKLTKDYPKKSFVRKIHKTK